MVSEDLREGVREGIALRTMLGTRAVSEMTCSTLKEDEGNITPPLVLYDYESLKGIQFGHSIRSALRMQEIVNLRRLRYLDTVDPSSRDFQALMQIKRTYCLALNGTIRMATGARDCVTHLSSCGCLTRRPGVDFRAARCELPTWTCTN